MHRTNGESSIGPGDVHAEDVEIIDHSLNTRSAPRGYTLRVSRMATASS
jgi:hypothetical protein